MPMRAIRGATTARANTPTAILDATRELLDTLIRANRVSEDDVASILFTITRDLDAVFPARAARELGWTHTALLDAQAPDVGGDICRCIRVLVHWNTDRPAGEIQHVYLREAQTLRPDRQ